MYGLNFDNYSRKREESSLPLYNPDTSLANIINSIRDPSFVTNEGPYVDVTTLLDPFVRGEAHMGQNRIKLRYQDMFSEHVIMHELAHHESSNSGGEVENDRFAKSLIHYN